MAKTLAAISAVSAHQPDWSREAKPFFSWNPGKSLLASIRAYQHANASRSRVVRAFRRIHVIRYRFWSAVSGAEIPLNTSIGGGLLIPHPNGIVVHSDAVIGPNCLLFQQVTLAGPVRLDGHVDIGAGAKIIGPLTIGSHSEVGANAVVLSDVPAGSVAVGIPARIVART